MPKHAKCHCPKHHCSERSNKSNKYKCRVCTKFHPLRNCHKFQGMSIAERQKCVKQNNYCINCLAHDHKMKQCSSKRRCKICGKLHHSMLHVEMRRDIAGRLGPRPAAPNVRPPARNIAAPDLVAHIRVTDTVLMPTVCCALKLPDDVSHTVRCLLSTGSPRSYVDELLVEKFGLEKHFLDDTTSCWLTLESLHDDCVVVEHLFRVKELDTRTPSVSLSASCGDFFRNMTLADPRFFKSDVIDVLIGMDLYTKLLIPGDISKPGQPYARNTIFGYTIEGSHSD